MKQPKRCAICDQPIRDKGRKYCAECIRDERGALIVGAAWENGLDG